jgi:CubicO group peptidase (beta-lactamase class C family)
VAPAGAHWSTGTDMARYLQTLLDTSDAGGLISPEAFAHLTTPQVPVSATMSYGLGWFVEDWHGHRLIHHGGNTIGYTSELAFLPEVGAGIVILTNAGRATDFVQAVRARFMERLFDIPETHHSGALIALAESNRQSEAWAGAMPVDRTTAKAAEGLYRSDTLGEVMLINDGVRLVFGSGEMSGELRVDPANPARWIIWEGPLFTMPLAFDSEALTITLGEGAARYVFDVIR